MKQARVNVVASHDILFWVFNLLVSLYAIINTNGSTVLLAIPLTLTLLYILKPWSKVSLSDYSFDRTSALTLIVFLGTYITYSAPFVVSFDQGKTAYLWGDAYFYSNVAEFLNAFGKETTEINLLDPNSTSLAPYHYFELWFCAFISKLFGTTTYKTLFLVVYPTFAALGSYYMFNALKTIFLHVNGKILFIAALMLPLLESFSQFFPAFLFKYDIYSTSVWGWPKLTVVYFFISYFFLQFSKRNYLNLLAAAVCASAGYISIFPALFSISLLIGIILMRRKSINAIQLFSVMVLFSYVPLFYLYHSMDTLGGGQGFELASYLFLSFKIFGSSFLQYSIAIPFIIIIALYYRRNASKLYKTEILFLFSLGVAGLTAWSVLNPIGADAVQFFTNIFIVSIVILSMISLMIGIQYGIKLSYLIIALWLINSAWAITNNYRNDRFTVESHKIEKIKAFVLEEKPLFVTINKNVKNLFQLHPFNNSPCGYLSLLYHPYVCYNICELDSIDFENKFQLEKYTKKSPYVRFKHAHPEKSQVDFIKKYKINYLISDAGNNSISTQIRPLIKDSLIVSEKEVIYSIKCD